MKKGVVFLVSLTAVACLSACVSGQARQSAETVTPADIVGQRLEGIEDSEGKSITFKSDGVLAIVTDEGAFDGNWEYESSSERALRPWTISWMVGDEQHGYIALVVRRGDVYTLTGNWFVTDAFIQMNEVYQLASPAN